MFTGLCHTLSFPKSKGTVSRPIDRVFLCTYRNLLSSCFILRENIPFKSSNFHRNREFDFWKSCHEIKFNKLQSTSILVIQHFIPKLLCTVRIFYSNLDIYLVAFGNIAKKLGKRNFDILAAYCLHSLANLRSFGRFC